MHFEDHECVLRRKMTLFFSVQTYAQTHPYIYTHAPFLAITSIYIYIWTQAAVHTYIYSVQKFEMRLLAAIFFLITK